MGLLLELPLAIALAIAGSGDGRSAPGSPLGTLFASPFLAPLRLGAALAASGAGLPLPVEDERWLAAVKVAGGEAGLAAEAARIFVTSSGRHYVPVASERTHILALQRQPAVLSAVAAIAAREAAARLTSDLGRPAAVEELVLALVLDGDAAARLIRLVDREPAAILARRLPEIAVRLPELAFSHRRPRTVGEAMAEVRLRLARSSAGAPKQSEPVPMASGDGARAADGPRVAGWTMRVAPPTPSTRPRR